MAVAPSATPANSGFGFFFIISGFLITKLLFLELEESGSISLRRFYFRRTIRIFPAFYCYLTIIGLLSALNLMHVTGADLRNGSLYLMNYAKTRSWSVGHLWSLSVEEQFYLMWLAVVCALGRKHAMRVATLLAAVAPISRVILWYSFSNLRFGIGEFFPTIMDALATGCLLAGFERQLISHAGYNRFSASRYFLIVPASIIGANSLGAYPSFAFVSGDAIINAGIGLCVHRCIQTCDTWFGRVLNSSPVIFIGVMSYSLYLWQQPFLDRYAPSPLTTFPINVLVAFVCASLSYFGLERPLLQHRRYLEQWLFQSAAKTPSSEPTIITNQPAVAEECESHRVITISGSLLCGRVCENPYNDLSILDQSFSNPLIAIPRGRLSLLSSSFEV